MQGGAGNPNREWESSCYLNFYQIFMLVFSFCLYFVLIIKYDHLKTKLKFNRIFVNVLCFKALNEQTIQLVTSNNKSNKHNGVKGKGFLSFSPSFSKSSRFPVGFFRVFRNFLLQISQIFENFFNFRVSIGFSGLFWSS